MAEERSISEICKDLLILVKTFQKAYRESIQEEEEGEGEEKDMQGEGRAILQENKRQMEQRKKTDIQQENTLKGNSEIQQIDNSTNRQINNYITFLDDWTRGKGDKKRKTRLIRPGKRDRSWTYQNQWDKRGRSGRPIEEVIKLAKGKRRRRERGKGGSYKNRRKKGKERVKLMDWNLKENG